MKDYSKNPLSIDDQIKLLESRGLHIPDRERVRHYLSYISYYRLRAYTYPYQDNEQPDHPFHSGITFDRILEDYLFDRQLRILIFDAIERIEVAFRTQVIHHYAMKYGPHWFENKKLFKNEVLYHVCGTADLLLLPKYRPIPEIHLSRTKLSIHTKYIFSYVVSHI